MAADDYIVRFTDPARGDGELLGSTFLIKPFTVNGPQHPIIDVNFTDPETGNATSRQGPLVLYGKGIPEYGEQMANNLLQLSENFAGSSAPTITGANGEPLPGVTWFQDEKYWVDTAGQDIFVWNDVTDSWADVTSLASWSTNAPGFDIAANRAAVFPAPVTGDYFYATDTGELSVFFVWTDFTPTIQAWLTRISRNEGFSPTIELPRRTLSVYDPTVGTDSFVKLLSYKGNDVGDPMTGSLILSGNPTLANEAANKDYVDTEIAAAIGGNNQLHQLLDVDATTADATLGTGVPPFNGNALFFDTSLVDANVDGKWTARSAVAADITDFSAAADARIALAVLDDLADVTAVNGPAIDGFALVYNDGAGEWQATATAATDTFLQYNNEPGLITPYSVDGTGLLTMTRNDAQDITVDNITPQTDYIDHVAGTSDRHDSEDIDWDPANNPLAIGGTPANVEQVLQLLDAAVAGASGTGYTQFATLLADTNATGSSTAGSGEAPANTLNLRSANDRFTIAITDDDVTNGDNVIFTVVEANIDHDQLTNFLGVEHVDHSAVSVTAGADSGVTAVNNDLTANIGLSVDIVGTTSESTVDGAADLFLMWDVSAGALRSVLGDDLPGGGGGGNAYQTITGIGANASGTASASGSDTLNLQSNNNLLTILVDEPGTDRVQFTVNQANISITESQVSDLGTYLENVSEDATPQLGGDLDVDGNSIISTSTDIVITPGATNAIVLDQVRNRNTAVTTTDATPTVLQTITPTDPSVEMGTARITARDTASGDAAWFYVRWGHKNIGGTVNMVGSVVQDTGADAGASTWLVAVAANGGNTAIDITVTGEAATNINWDVTTEIGTGG